MLSEFNLIVSCLNLTKFWKISRFIVHETIRIFLIIVVLLLILGEIAFQIFSWFYLVILCFYVIFYPQIPGIYMKTRNAVFGANYLMCWMLQDGWFSKNQRLNPLKKQPSYKKRCGPMQKKPGWKVWNAVSNQEMAVIIGHRQNLIVTFQVNLYSLIPALLEIGTKQTRIVAIKNFNFNPPSHGHHLHFTTFSPWHIEQHPFLQLGISLSGHHVFFKINLALLQGEEFKSR